MIGTKALAVACIALAALGVACGRQEVSYRQNVNPIFQKNCKICHNKEGVGCTTSGFNIENYKTVMKGTKYGPVIVPGSSISSSLMRMVQHETDPSINMPKEYSVIVKDHKQVVVPSADRARQLTPRELQLIRTWIDQGAKDN